MSLKGLIVAASVIDWRDLFKGLLGQRRRVELVCIHKVGVLGRNGRKVLPGQDGCVTQVKAVGLACPAEAHLGVVGVFTHLLQ